jgi:heat shock protein HtpX
MAVTPQFNASFGQYGLRRRRIVALGLPLFVMLEPRERLALLAHELGHGANGDPNRGLYVGTAINSLLTWRYLLYPERIIPPGGGLMVLAGIPANLIRLGTSQVPWAGAYLLTHLLWRGSQYLADHLAATVTGTEAMQSMLEKLYFAPVYRHTVHHVSLNRQDERLFDELKRQATEIPEQDLQAIKASVRDETTRLDTTHPPTAYRDAFLRSRAVEQPAVVLSAVESDRIDAKLAALHAPMRRRILDAHRRSLEVAYY